MATNDHDWLFNDDDTEDGGAQSTQIQESSPVEEEEAETPVEDDAHSWLFDEDEQNTPVRDADIATYKNSIGDAISNRVALQRDLLTKLEYVKSRSSSPDVLKDIKDYEDAIGSRNFGSIATVSDDLANEAAAQVDEWYQTASENRSWWKRQGDAMVGRINDMAIGTARAFDRNEELYHRMTEENRATHPKTAGSLQDIQSASDLGNFASEAFFENLPNLASGTAGAMIGAGIGSLAGPVGTYIGGMIGAGIGTLFANYGEVAENQYAENGDIDYGWAWGETLGYSALDSLGEGRIAARFARGLMSSTVKNEAKAAGRSIARQALTRIQSDAARKAFNTSWKGVVKDVAGDVLMEMWTEPTQSNVITRGRRYAQTGSGLTKEEQDRIANGEASVAGTVFWDVMNEAVAAGFSALVPGAISSTSQTQKNRRDVRQAQKVLNPLNRALNDVEGARQIVATLSRDVDFQNLDEYDQMLLGRKQINANEIGILEEQRREALEAGDARRADAAAKQIRDILGENAGIDEMLSDEAATLQRAFNGLFAGDFKSIPADIKSRVDKAKMGANEADIEDGDGNIIGKTYTDEDTQMQVVWDKANNTYIAKSLDPSRRIPARNNRFKTLDAALDYAGNLDRLFQMRDARKQERMAFVSRLASELNPNAEVIVFDSLMDPSIPESVKEKFIGEIEAVRELEAEDTEGMSEEERMIHALRLADARSKLHFKGVTDAKSTHNQIFFQVDEMTDVFDVVNTLLHEQGHSEIIDHIKKTNPGLDVEDNTDAGKNALTSAYAKLFFGPDGKADATADEIEAIDERFATLAPSMRLEEISAFQKFMRAMEGLFAKSGGDISKMNARQARQLMESIHKFTPPEVQREVGGETPTTNKTAPASETTAGDEMAPGSEARSAEGTSTPPASETPSEAPPARNGEESAPAPAAEPETPEGETPAKTIRRLNSEAARAMANFGIKATVTDKDGKTAANPDVAILAQYYAGEDAPVENLSPAAIEKVKARVRELGGAVADGANAEDVFKALEGAERNTQTPPAEPAAEPAPQATSEPGKIMRVEAHPQITFSSAGSTLKMEDGRTATITSIQGIGKYKDRDGDFPQITLEMEDKSQYVGELSPDNEFTVWQYRPGKNKEKTDEKAEVGTDEAPQAGERGGDRAESGTDAQAAGGEAQVAPAEEPGEVAATEPTEAEAQQKWNEAEARAQKADTYEAFLDILREAATDEAVEDYAVNNNAVEEARDRFFEAHPAEHAKFLKGEISRLEKEEARLEAKNGSKAELDEVRQELQANRQELADIEPKPAPKQEAKPAEAKPAPRTVTHEDFIKNLYEKSKALAAEKGISLEEAVGQFSKVKSHLKEVQKLAAQEKERQRQEAKRKRDAEYREKKKAEKDKARRKELAAFLAQTGDTTAHGIIQAAQEGNGIVGLPRNFADYWRDHKKWEAAIKRKGNYNGVPADRHNEPKRANYGIGGEADFIEGILDGRSFKDPVVEFFFGRNALAESKGRGTGDYENAVREFANGNGLPELLKYNADGTVDVDSFINDVQRAYDKFNAWRENPESVVSDETEHYLAQAEQEAEEDAAATEAERPIEEGEEVDDSFAFGANAEEEGQAEAAPEATDEEDFSLESVTPEQLEAEQQHQAQQAAIQAQLEKPITGTAGEIGQTLMDLGGEENEDLFNPTVRQPQPQTEKPKPAASTVTDMDRAEVAANRHVVKKPNGTTTTLAKMIAEGTATLHMNGGLTMFDKDGPRVVTIGFDQYKPTKAELPYLIQLQKEYDAAHPQVAPAPVKPAQSVPAQVDMAALQAAGFTGDAALIQSLVADFEKLAGGTKATNDASPEATEARSPARHYRRATVEEEQRLNQEKTIIVYRAMQVYDGQLFPPMAAIVGGKRVMGIPLTQDGKVAKPFWQIADEIADIEDAIRRKILVRDKKGNLSFTLDKGDGNGTITAAYNPYWHTSNRMLNDQFDVAYKRNLVVVKCEVPVSEGNGAYHAPEAKDATGWMGWHSGPVAAWLRDVDASKSRDVFLSRYCKVLEVVPDATVAKSIADDLRGSNISIPSNVITKSLRAELEKLGVPIFETITPGGRYDKKAYTAHANAERAKLKKQRAAERKAAQRQENSRFNLVVNPNLKADVEAALVKNPTGNPDVRQMKRHEDVVFSENLPFFEFLGLPNARVISDATRVRKAVVKHHLNTDQISSLPRYYNAPVAAMRGNDGGYLIVTSLHGKDSKGNIKPVVVYLRPTTGKNGEMIFLASAYPPEKEDEVDFYKSYLGGNYLFVDENKVAGLALEEETRSILRTQASGDRVMTSSDYSLWSTRNIMPQSNADVKRSNQNSSRRHYRRAFTAEDINLAQNLTARIANAMENKRAEDFARIVYGLAHTMPAYDDDLKDLLISRWNSLERDIPGLEPFPYASVVKNLGIFKAIEDAAANPQPQTQQQAQAAQTEQTEQKPAAQPKPQPQPANQPQPQTAQQSESEFEARRVSQIADAANEIVDLLENGVDFDRADLEKIVGRNLGGSVATGAFEMKDVTDILELAVNRYMMNHADIFNPAAKNTPEAAQRAITEIRNRILAAIPTQTTRSSEQIKMQQFSTPPHEAFIAAWVANVGKGDVALEPSAGIGGIAVFDKLAGAEVIVNELAARRARILKALGLSPRVYRENAENLHAIFEPRIKKGEVARPTVVVMNPPFSNAQTVDKKNTHIGAQHVEEALRLLAPGGRLVAIVGNGMAQGKPAFAAWWNRIGKQYTVRANIGINGAEYAKYGTDFDNNLIVIDKVAPDGTTEPIYGKVESIDELPAMLEGVRNERQPIQANNLEGNRQGIGQGQRGTTGETVPRGPERLDSARNERGKPGVRPDINSGRADGETGGANGRESGNRASGRNGNAGRGPNGGRVRANDNNRSAEGNSANTGLADSGSSGGLAPNAVELEAGRNVGKREIGDGTFTEYKPSKVHVKGAKPHPTALVEPSAMASTLPPDPHYSPKIPQRIIDNGVLSEAQIEQVVMAGQSMDEVLADGRRKGYFIGDGTGVGKGREISGIILDNWNHGRQKAVWISETPDLAPDARRDLTPFGLGDELLELRKKKNLGKFSKGIVFTGYKSLSSNHGGIDAETGKPKRSKNDGKQSNFERIVEWLGRDFDGVIVFDEAHNAGNAIAIKGKRGMKKPSAQALAVVDLQNALPNARILYVSATGATEVSNLSYCTRLGLWGEGTAFKDRTEFISQVSAGGLSAMEIVARDMKALGVYLARSLSYEGVENTRLEHKLTPAQINNYNELADAWAMVAANIRDAMITTNIAQSSNASKVMSAFWGANQRFFNSVLSALQMPSVIADMKKKLAAGESCVLQLTQTNEATTKRAIEKAKRDAAANNTEVDLDQLDLSPREQLIEYVRHSFPTAKYVEEMDAEGNPRFVPLTDADGKPVEDPSAVEMRDELIYKLSNIKMGEGILDMVIEEFGAENVAEISGRTQRRQAVRGEDGTMEMRLVPRSPAMRAKEAQEFNDGKRRILVFSAAGGTGFSYHAGRDFKNQQMRNHYLVQAGWRADKALQGFGRTHRSNEAQPPRYILCSTDIRGHQRFISSVARRLAQLGSLTGGDRSSAGSGIFSEADNLETSYARTAIFSIFEDMFHNDFQRFQEVSRMMGYVKPRVDNRTGEVKDVNVLIDQETGGLNEDEIPDVQQFLNRILTCRVEEQNRIFDNFMDTMRSSIEAAKEAGTYDPGLTRYTADRIIEKSRTVLQEKEGTSQKTELVEMAIQNKAKRVSYGDMKARLQTAAGTTPYVVRNKDTGMISAIVPTHNVTFDTRGQHTIVIKLSPDGKRERVTDTSVRTTGENARYEQIPAADEERVWDDAVAKIPELTPESPRFFITGTVLPVWDKLNMSSPRIYRIGATEGNTESFLGMQIPDTSVNDTLLKFGKAGRKADRSPGAVLTDIISRNKTIPLQNGWELQRRRVLGENRVEVKGITSLIELGKVERSGVAFRETIAGKPSLFVPATVEGIERFLKTYPAYEAETEEGETGAATEAATDTHTILQNAFNGDFGDPRRHYRRRAVDLTQADRARYGFEGEGITGGSNRAVKAALEDAGIEHEYEAPHKPAQEVLDEAEAARKNGDVSVEQIARDFENGKSRQLTPVENAILVHELAAKRDEYNASIARLNELIMGGGAPADITAVNEQIAASIADMERLADIFDRGGTEIGRALAMRQAELNRQMNLVWMLRQVQGVYSHKGPDGKTNVREDIPQSVRDEVTRLSAENERLTAEIERLQAELAAKEGASNLIAQHGGGGTDTRAGTRHAPKTNANNERVEAGGRKTRIKVSDLTPEERDEYEERLHDRALQRASNKLTQTGALIGIDLEKLVEAEARYQIHKGVRNAEQLIGNVQDTLAAFGIDLTPRQVQDIFSHYGRQTIPSQAEEDVARRDLRQQAMKMSALDDVLNDQAPRKTGFVRDEPSKELRDRLRELKRAMKEHGINARDRETQLKSALDAVKTRLRNGIEDLDWAIRHMTAIPKSDKGVEYDEEAKQLKAERDRLQAEYDAIFNPALTEAERLDALLTNLRERLLQRERDVADIERGVYQAPAKKVDEFAGNPEVQQLRKQIREMESRKRNLLVTEQDRLNALKQRLQTWEQKLLAAREGEFAARKQKRQPTEAEAQLLDEIWELRHEYAHVLDLANRETPDLEAQARAIRRRLNRQIAIDEWRIENQAFETEKRKPFDYSTMPQEIQDLVKRRDAVRKEFAEKRDQWEFEHANKFKKVWRTTADLFTTLRNLRASGDISGIGVQCANWIVAHPKDGLNAVIPGLRSLFSSKSADEIMAEIMSMKRAKYYQDVGLGISFYGDIGQRLGAREEMFAHRENPYLKRLMPSWARDSKLTRGVGMYMEASERGFTVPVDYIRAMAFETICDSVGRELSKEDMQAVASIVNIATGKGDMKFFKEGALKDLLWAPSRVSAQLQMMGHFAQLGAGLVTGQGYGRYKDVSADVRKAMFKQVYAKGIRNNLILFGLLRLLSCLFWDDEDDDKRIVSWDSLNPISPKFGKLNFGGRLVSVNGNMEQYFRTPVQMVLGKRKNRYGETVKLNEGYGATTSWELAENVLYRNKLTPALSIMMGLLNRQPERFTNAKIENAGDVVEFVIRESIVPLSVENAAAAMREEGVLPGAVFAALEIAGASSYRTDNTEESREREFKHVFTKFKAKATTDEERRILMRRYPYLRNRSAIQARITRLAELDKLAKRNAQLGVSNRSLDEQAKRLHGEITELMKQAK